MEGLETRVVHVVKESLEALRSSLLGELQEMRARISTMEEKVDCLVAAEQRGEAEGTSHLEESAKKQVESASSGSAMLKLYNQWHDKLDPEEKGDVIADERNTTSEVVESKEKVGLLKKVKNQFRGKEKSKDVADNESESALLRSQSKEDGLNDSGRQTVEAKPIQKYRSTKSRGNVTSEVLEEKEETIRHLEEVNRTLKQTNDDLNEDVAELRRQLQEALSKLAEMESASQQLQEEKRELMANLNIRGWLLKRGVKGPTGSFWRRRYFRCDQGSKVYYYKSASEGTPQGYIDLDKIISVQEVSPAQQDKNHASFLVQCDGRTYQLQAMDEANMRKWMSALNYLRDYRRKHLQEAAAATN